VFTCTAKLTRTDRKAQYEKRLRAWGLTKNYSKATWEIVARKVNKRKQDNKDSDVHIDGQLVPAKKLKKALQRYGTCAGGFFESHGSSKLLHRKNGDRTNEIF
jgi:hypothetical protein